MRIFFLGNNWVGWQIVQWLKAQNEQIVGAALHPSQKRKYGDEILQAAAVEMNHVFDGSQLQHPDVLKAIAALKPDIGLSILFGYIYKPEFINLFPAGIVNLHPSYLPFNRGQYPNVWSIVEGTPAGVTIHYIDAGIDTGDIVAQQQVPVEPIDTGERLYHKLEQISVDLFKQTWPLIRSGQPAMIAQNKDVGSYHRTTDVAQIDLIDLDKMYTARQLIDIIRARTFPPYAGAYFVDEGRKVYLKLQLDYEDQQNSDAGEVE